MLKRSHDDDDIDLLFPAQIRRLGAPVAPRSDDYSALIAEIALHQFARSDVVAVVRGSWAIRLHLAAQGVDVTTASARRCRVAAQTDIDFYLLTDDAASAKACRPVHKHALSEECGVEGLNTSTSSLHAPTAQGSSTPGRKLADFTVRAFSKSTSRRRRVAAQPRAVGNTVEYSGCSTEDQQAKLDRLSVLLVLDDSPFVADGACPASGGWRALRIEQLVQEYAENRRVALPFTAPHGVSPIRSAANADAVLSAAQRVAQLLGRLRAAHEAAAARNASPSVADVSLVAQSVTSGGGGGRGGGGGGGGASGGGHSYHFTAEHSDDGDGRGASAPTRAFVLEWMEYAAQLLEQIRARVAMLPPGSSALSRVEELVRSEELDAVRSPGKGAATSASASASASASVVTSASDAVAVLKQREDDWKACVLHLLAALTPEPTAGEAFDAAHADDGEDLSRSRRLF